MREPSNLRRGRTWIAPTSIAFTIALGLLTGRAHAQSAEAQALFDDGLQWMDEGKLDRACDAFDASNRVESRAGTLIRLGECRERNHQLASAWSAYRDALARAKDPQKHILAQQQVAALQPRLSYLTVVVSDENRLESLTVTRNDKPLEAARWNYPLPVDGGDYVIAAQADGYQTWQVTVHVPFERAQIRVEIPPLVKLSKPKPVPPPEPMPPPEPVIQPPSETTPVLPPTSRDAPRPASTFTTRRMIGIGAAGMSVGAAALGVALGVNARGKQNEALKLCPMPACQEADAANALIKTGHRRALEANIAFGVAATAAIGAAALWFTGSPRSETSSRVTVLPEIALDRAGLVFVGRL